MLCGIQSLQIKEKIVEYFERKAKLLNLNKLSWLDVTAAVNVGDFEEKNIHLQKLQILSLKTLNLLVLKWRV